MNERETEPIHNDETRKLASVTVCKFLHILSNGCAILRPLTGPMRSAREANILELQHIKQLLYIHASPTNLCHEGRNWKPSRRNLKQKENRK